MIIAIDGPSGSGKGTLARNLADHFNLAYLDTGLLYRAVAYKLIQDDIDFSDEVAAAHIAQSLHHSDLASPELRGDRAALAASKVAVIKGVRDGLLEFERNFAHNPPNGNKGAVLDGRDIGTVVLPEADFKFFITASVEIRAQRRYKELLKRGIESIYTTVLENMQERDSRDTQRSISPLTSAKDAYVIDTSDMNADEVSENAIKYIERRGSSIKQA